MSLRSLSRALLAALLAGSAAGRRVSLSEAQDLMLNATSADEAAAALEAYIEQDEAMHAGVKLVSIEEAEERAEPFQQVVAASAPISTACSWWNNPSGKSFYKQYGSVCGVQGDGQAAIDAHIARVWGLIEAARAQLAGASGNGRRTLHVFLAPEWTFRRYPIGGATEIKPLSFGSMHYILGALLDKIKEAKPLYDNWLIVPGSIYWGVPIPRPPSAGAYGPAPKYAVFNTLPIIYDGKLVFAHNKFMQADNLDTANEIWGYDLMKQFPSSSGCKSYGDAGKICGADKFVAWLQANQKYLGEDVATAVMDWGVKQPADAIVVNGLVLGVDICLDHRMDIGHRARAVERLKSLVHVDKFDIQLLVSSGMSFSIPEEDGAISLLLRANGVALSADGVQGPNGAQLFRREPRKVSAQDQFSQKHGAIKLHTDGRNFVKISLAEDFEEMPGALQGIWGSGCVNLPTEVGCAPCKSGSMRAITTPQNAHMFCSTETGNWRLLKTWATPIQVLAPQSGVSKILAPGTEGAVAVKG